jgi:filamentous hemagglutinin
LADDVIIGKDGRHHKIERISQRYEQSFPVSNLTIGEFHNYAVGVHSILVHNESSVCQVGQDALQDMLNEGTATYDEIAEFLRSEGFKNVDEVMAKLARGLPAQAHHLATNKGKWGEKFENLFGRAGVDLDDAINKMDLPGHVGRHTDKYHQWVFDQLEAAVAGKQGQAAKDALTSALSKIRKRLEANPRLPYADGGI